MDHVQDNNSMRGNENYAHELGQQMNNYIVDPSLIDQNQWVQQQQQQQQPQYAEDIFNSQQAYQLPHQHPHQHQLSHQHPQQLQQQQYIQPAQPQFNYGASQSPVYSNAQYPDVYAQQQPLRSNSLGQQYGVQYGGYPTTSQSPIQQVPQQMPQQVPQQIPHQSHQQYVPNQGQYSYSPQPQVPISISPHDLDRAVQYPPPVPARNSITPQPLRSNSASQDFSQSWTSEPEFQEQPIPISTTPIPVPQYRPVEQEIQHAPPRPVVSRPPAILPGHTLASVVASQPEPVNQAPPASQPIPSQPIQSQPIQSQPIQSQPVPSQPIPSVSDAVPKYATAPPRITHPELLAETKDIPSRRFSKAPYAILGVGSIELDNKYASKALPIWQGRPNRSGKVLVPGLEHKLSVMPTIKPKKIRAPGTKKYASARKSNLLEKERPRPLSSQPPVGGESSSLRPPSLSPEDSSSEYTSSEDESEYSDEEEELGDMRTLAEIRPEPRPSDVAEAASWDALGIMYSPPGRRATTEEKMRVAMEFHPFIAGLREELVRVTADLAKAEAEKRDADVKTLKVERATRQQALVNALNIAITKGHQDLKDTLATIDKFVVGLTNILRNCIKADDYLGDLALAVFHLMSAFTKTSEAVLTRSKFDGIVKKFNKNRLESKNVDLEGKRRQEDIKRFVEKITKNTLEAQDRAILAAAEDSNRRAELAKSGGEPKPAVPADVKAGAQPGSSLKRPHEPDTASNAPNKKVASEGAKGLPVKPSGNKVPIKTTGFFAKLGKQGPKAAPAPSVPAAKPVVKKPAPSTGPSTLSMLLADISKPKEVPKAPEAPKRPDETPEEKIRRERKESRRHLRVKFREGDALTDVRIFTHERSEDEGRQGEMLRDAHDDRSEGMMHKQRFQGVADVEDDETEAEVNNKPWPVLSEVDFSSLAEGYYGKAFTSRGGPVEFETPQQRIQTEREDKELMVVYTDVKDIPNSPKEPPFEQLPAPVSSIPHLRQPTNFPAIQARLLDIRLYGADAAMKRLFRNEDEQRLGIHREKTQQRAAAVLGLKNHQITVPVMLNAISNSPAFPKKTAPVQKSLEQNLTSLAGLQAGTPTEILFPPTAPPAQDTPPYPTPPGMDPADWATLHRIFVSKTGLPFPAIEAPEWMTPPAKRVWYETLLKEQIAKVARDKAYEDRMAAEAAQARLQPAVGANEDLMSQLQKIIAPQQPQQQVAYPPPASRADDGGDYDPSDLQNILKGLGYAQTPQQGQWGAPAQGQGGYQEQQPAWLASVYAGIQKQAAPPASAGWGAPAAQPQAQASSWGGGYGQGQSGWGDGGRDAQDGGDNNGNGGGGGKKPWETNGGGGGGNKFSKNRLDPDYKRGTKPCRFWQEGKCAKGANCTFIHE